MQGFCNRLVFVTFEFRICLKSFNFLRFVYNSYFFICKIVNKSCPKCENIRILSCQIQEGDKSSEQFDSNCQLFL